MGGIGSRQVIEPTASIIDTRLLTLSHCEGAASIIDTKVSNIGQLAIASIYE